MPSAELNITSLTFRALTEDDLGQLLSGRCAPEAANIIDRLAMQSVDGNQFTASASVEIADLIINAAGPIMVEIVALGTGLTSLVVEQLPFLDRIVATLQVVDLTVNSSDFDEMSERVLAKLLVEASKTSAAASGGVSH